MAAPNVADLATALIVTAPSPALSGTSIIVEAGKGQRLPAVPFIATLAPEGLLPTLDTAEMVTVTNRSTDTLTIQRTYGNTTAKVVQHGWRLFAGPVSSHITGAYNRANHTGTQLSSTISDFAAAVAANAPVSSVAGKTGVVLLAESDIGNLTSDLAAKATTTALTAETNRATAAEALKANDSAVIHNTGNETVGGIKTFTSAPVVPSNSFPESAITSLVTDLAAKVPTSRQVTGNNGLTGGGDLSADRTIGLATVPGNTMMGNNTGSTALPSNLTASQVKALLAITEGDVASLVADLSAKAALASPAFTGVPTAPTAAADTATTQIATTSFVEGEISRAKLPNFYIAPHGYTGKADYICAGTSNNDVEINAAIIAANALTNGGNVILLPGAFVITNHIMRLPNVHLFGHGIGVTKVSCVSGFTQNMIDMDKATYNNTNPMVNSWVYDMELDASNMLASSASKCINGGNFSRCKLFRIFAHDSTATGIGDDDFYGTTIDQCITLNCGYSNKHTITSASWAANAFTFTTADAHNYVAWVQATGILTASGTISDGDTVTLDGLVYTFKTTLTGAAYEVFINGSAANALTNLKSAVNGTGTAGTDYGTGTVKLGSATGTTLTSTTLTFAAANYGVTGNAIVSTASGANISFGAGTLTGGVSGNKVTITGILPALYNGTYNVTSIVDANNFTISGANNSTLLNFGSNPGTPTQYGLTSDALIGHNGIGIASGSLTSEACLVTNSICIGAQNNNFLIEADNNFSATNVFYNFSNCVSIYAGSCGHRNTGSLNAQFNGCYDFGSPIGGTAVPVTTTRTITAASWSAGVATFTTSVAHGFSIGFKITLAGMLPTGYNGDFIVQSTPDGSTFTVNITNNPGTALLLGTASYQVHPVDGSSFNSFVSVNNVNYGLDIDGPGVMVNNPVIYGGYNFGARLLNASYSQINDARIYNNGNVGVLLQTSGGVTTPMTHVNITGFIYNNGTRYSNTDGVDFSPSSTAPIQNVTLDIHAFDDQPTKTQRYGVILRSGGTLTNIVVRGNLTGNATAPTLVQNTSSSIYFDNVVGVNPNGPVSLGNITGSTTFDVTQNNLFVATMTGAVTAVMPTPVIGGARMTWILQQDSTGGRTLSLPANANTQTTLTLSTGANVVDIISWVYDTVAGKWRLAGKLLGNTGVGTLNNLIITTPNGNNTVSLNLTQNDTTNNPDGFDLTNAGTSHGQKILQSGVLAANKYGLFVDSAAAQVNAPLVRFRQNSASSTTDTLQLDNAGSGNALFVNTGAIKLTGGVNLVLSTVTGTQFGTATTQKLAFYGSTAIVQPTGDVLTALTNLGLVGSPTISEADVTNLTTDLAAKAPLASPALTGSPTAPTQAAGDNSTKIATDAFVTTAVNNAIAGVNPAVAVQAATAAVLPNSPTYNNGVSGIGATLTTATTNTALVVDGYTPALNDRILVKNQASAFQNGVYTVTQVAALGLAWILTRALDYDMPSDMNNTGAIPVVNGTANTGTSWVQTSQVATVGTDAVTYTQFTLNPTTLMTTTTYDAANIAQQVVGTTATQTMTNKRINPRAASTASSSTPTPNSDTTDLYVLTALAAAATFGAPSGTPVDGQKLYIRIKDNGTARALTWNAAYVNSGVASLPTTTIISKTHTIGLMYDGVAAAWICLASDTLGY